MWNKDKSVVLSIVCTRGVIAIAIVLAVALPFLISGGFFLGRALIAANMAVLLMPVYYAFCVPALIALFSLDRMLVNIKHDEVFVPANVRYLRILSWCCFAAAAVLLVSTFVSVIFFFIGLLAGFFGVVLRSMKNLFAAAVELKTENDYTI